MAFSLEKDVQLVGVACRCNVHVFEYSEEADNSLVHMANVPVKDINQLVFVESMLVMLKKEGSNLIVSCYIPEEE